MTAGEEKLRRKWRKSYGENQVLLLLLLLAAIRGTTCPPPILVWVSRRRRERQQFGLACRDFVIQAIFQCTNTTLAPLPFEDGRPVALIICLGRKISVVLRPGATGCRSHKTERILVHVEARQHTDYLLLYPSCCT